MNLAVPAESRFALNTYGWRLDLRQDFHPTKQGIRFTIETARREVLEHEVH